MAEPKNAENRPRMQDVNGMKEESIHRMDGGREGRLVTHADVGTEVPKA